MLVPFTEFYKDYVYKESSDFLGRGAFGETFKAFSKLREKAVAVKFYRGDISSYDLSQEIKTAINLEHRSLIRYYNYFQIDYGDHKEQVSVMEFANGGDLTQLLHKELDLKLLKGIARDVLEALLFLETQKTVHQDIKLENVLLHHTKGADKPVAKIADFGLAKKLSKDLFSKTKSSFITTSGTPPYMAPEIVDKNFACRNLYNKPVIKYNADLWAFGVMLYYIFFKAPPFGRLTPDHTLIQLMADIVTKEPDIKKINSLPKPFGKIIKECLVKNANDRVDSAGHLLKYFKTPPKPGSRPRKKIVIPPPEKPTGGVTKRKKITIRKTPDS